VLTAQENEFVPGDNPRRFRAMSQKPAGGSLLTRDPPVRGRDMFGSPSGSVVRTFPWFVLWWVYLHPRQIGSTNLPQNFKLRSAAKCRTQFRCTTSVQAFCAPISCYGQLGMAESLAVLPKVPNP